MRRRGRWLFNLDDEDEKMKSLTCHTPNVPASFLRFTRFPPYAEFIPFLHLHSSGLPFLHLLSSDTGSSTHLSIYLTFNLSYIWNLFPFFSGIEEVKQFGKVLYFGKAFNLNFRVFVRMVDDYIRYGCDGQLTQLWKLNKWCCSFCHLANSQLKRT